MPKQISDARLTQRSVVLEQHHGLVFRGTVTTYTDTTHFKVSGFPEYGNAADFGDMIFKDYYVYVIWDKDGAGAAPQGESQQVSNYTSADGTFTHTAFTTPLEAGDEVLLIHPSALNASVLAALDEIKGTLFVSSDDSLHAIRTELTEILDLTRTGADIAVTSAETNLFVDDAPSKIIAGRDIAIRCDGMGAADTYEFAEHYRIEAGATYDTIADPVQLSGVQTNPLYVINLRDYRYGCKITAKKIAGADISIYCETIREA